MAEFNRTALLDEHVALGARMLPFAGWELPAEYVGVAEEVRAVRESAGVIDLGHLAEFRVFGFAAFDFMQRVFSNDCHLIAQLGAGQRSLVLDEEGSVIDEALVFHTGDLEYMILSSAQRRDDLFAWMRQHAPQDLELVDESDRAALISLAGPAAANVVRELAPHGFEFPGAEAIGEAILDTIPTLLAHSSDVGEDGVLIVCGARNAPALWRAILSFAEVTPVGRLAHDVLRIEAGRTPLPALPERVEPLSAGLGALIPTGRQGFVGEHAVAASRAHEPSRLLVGLALGEVVPEPGAPVLRGGEVVGKVAGGAFSPSLRHGIATAFVDRASAVCGTHVEIETAEGTAEAVVAELPFVKMSQSE